MVARARSRTSGSTPPSSGSLRIPLPVNSVLNSFRRMLRLMMVLMNEKPKSIMKAVRKVKSVSTKVASVAADATKTAASAVKDKAVDLKDSTI